MSNIIDSIQLSGITYQIEGSGGGKAIEAGRGISITTGETADTVSFNLPISGGSGINSIIEGESTTANGNYSHAEGYDTQANNLASHAEGYQAKASGYVSHAEGWASSATSEASHAEGYSTEANGDYSHAEGYLTKASGYYSHAEGYYTIASGDSSHAEGIVTQANGEAAHAEGNSTIANNESEHASGQYNVSSSASTTFGDSGNTLFSVGNGTADNARHNAFEIRQNGDIYISSGNTDIKLQDHLGGGGSSYTAGDGIDITNDVISVTGKVSTSDFNTYTAATDTALASKADTATTYTKTEVDTALASKQATLTAGTGISIIDNVISAEGGGLTEDDELLLATALTDLNERKIDASEVKSNYQRKGDYATKDYVATALEPYETKLDEINTEEVTAYALNDLNERFGGLKIVKITESEYAALATKDENTLYVVVADPS